MSTPAWQGMPIPPWRRPAEQPTIRVDGADASTPTTGEVRAVAEPVEVEGPSAAVDEAKIAAAVDATPKPPSPREAARSEALTSSARAFVLGYQARCTGQAIPVPDLMDPTSGPARGGWLFADILAAAGVDPAKSNPFAAAEMLQPRIVGLARAATHANELHKAIVECAETLTFYENPAWAQVRVLPGVDRNAIDDGRRATTALASLKSKGVL